MNATNDLTDTENNWTLNPTEWQKIKSYLIIIENYTMSIKEKQVFSYHFLPILSLICRSGPGPYKMSLSAPASSKDRS